MKKEKYTLSFITPCFCAGANQSKAEFRAPSVRGELRWWFRALGGSYEEEKNLFGGIGIGKGDTTQSSKIMIRVKELSPGIPWQPPKVEQNNPSAYVWYFASVSGKESNQPGTGPRWKPGAALPPASRYSLQIVYREEVADPLFDRALKCFLLLGSIGLRSTRGLGAFYCEELPYEKEKVRQLLNGTGFKFEELQNSDRKDGLKLANFIGSTVKTIRKEKGWKSENNTLMGGSEPRQQSVIRFRPVLVDEKTKTFRVVAFEAPHDRVYSGRSCPTLVGEINDLLNPR